MFASIPSLDTGTLPWIENRPGEPNKPVRRELNSDPATGAVLWIVHEPAGFRGSSGGNPHYLPVDEEAYFLDGTMIGDPETTWVAGDYLFYPMGFLHSPDDATDTGATIVMRLSGPMSYVDVPLPPGHRWTRRDERQLLPGQANSRRPISRLHAPDLPWEDRRVDSDPTGERVKLLSEDRSTGATTFLWEVPAGWRSDGDTTPSQREWYIISGDYRVDGLTLGEGFYRCLAPGTAHGAEASRTGCLALCWLDGPLVAGRVTLG